jgi:4-alpha-glucanotransferase
VPTTRSSRSWGIGDLADVRAVGEWITRQGGQVVALSPLHSPTPVVPIATSPYYPSSRRWRSPLLIRVDEVGTVDQEVLGLASEARALLADPIVHRDECWARQRPALEHLWVRLGEGQRAEAARWRAEQGPELERWATFCTLAEQHGPDWRRWPARLQRPDATAVAVAAANVDDRVAFHAWLQQLIEEQLQRASTSGVRLVQDLAIGVDPGGADAWTWQDLLAPGFSVGAPPDEFQRAGQTWGLPPWIPWRLRDEGYRPLAALLRAAMVRGGGLRIDHVMGLTRLFWVPEDGEPADGAYVRFPAHDLLELVALESSRAEAIVVGEDLGTVEEGLREELRDRRLLSTRVVWFEDAPPEDWPAQSLAMVTTHDLPTLAGMHRGTDAPQSMRARLEHLVGPLDGQPLHEVDCEVHRRLARSPSVLAMATLEDLLEVEERPNVPGTSDEDRANWSRALPVAVDDLPGHARAGEVLAAMAADRA